MVHSNESTATPVLTTERLVLRLPPPEEAESVARFYAENQEHLRNSGPSNPSLIERSYWESQLKIFDDEFAAGQAARFFVYERGPDDKDIIGSVNLSNIIRRAAQFCYLGYGLAAAKQGRGYMTEAVAAVVDFGFTQLNLHRIMANYIPTNARSGAVLKRLGFKVEGYAYDYLYLDNRWQDHVMTAKVNANWDPTRA